MIWKSIKLFEKGDRVYFVSDIAEMLVHFQGTLLENVTLKSKEIILLGDDGEEIKVGSRDNPEWNLVEAVEDLGLLFLKQDSDQVVYVVVSEGEDSVELETDF